MTKKPNAGFGMVKSITSPSEHIANQFNLVHPTNGLRDYYEVSRYENFLTRNDDKVKPQKS